MARTLDIRNPRTGANDYTITPLSHEAMEARCQQLRAAQPVWQALGIEGRAAAMIALCDAVDRHYGAILQALCADTGRYEWSVNEIEGLKGITRMRCARQQRCGGNTRDSGRTALKEITATHSGFDIFF